LTAECGGNVHDHDIVRVTSSGERTNERHYAAENAVDLRADTIFASAYRNKDEAIAHERNHWICYEFMRHIVIPTHYSIRSFFDGAPGHPNLKSWIVEASMNGEHWDELSHCENNSELNGKNVTQTFETADTKVSRFVRLVNIGRNHRGSDQLLISSFELFGSLIGHVHLPPEGTIGVLTRRSGANVHDAHLVHVTSSRPQRYDRLFLAKNAVDLVADTAFISAYRKHTEAIAHEGNNWICYEFRRHIIVPTHYAIRSFFDGAKNCPNLKSWKVEASLDGDHWDELDHREDNSELNEKNVTGTFEVGRSQICRYMKLTNIGRNHRGSDQLIISAFDIFGSLIDDVLVPTGPLEGIIWHLTRECGGNVQDHGVVEITSSRALNESEATAAKNVADLTVDSVFSSAYRGREEDIGHDRNNWICYDFRTHPIIPTHYAIRSSFCGTENGPNMKSWLVETSLDGNKWSEIDHQEDNNAVNGGNMIGIFHVSRSGVSRFVRLVNIGRNHSGTNQLVISSLELFGAICKSNYGRFL
jgi:hypothetical protein